MLNYFSIFLGVTIYVYYTNIHIFMYTLLGGLFIQCILRDHNWRSLEISDGESPLRRCCWRRWSPKSSICTCKRGLFQKCPRGVNGEKPLSIAPQMAGFKWGWWWWWWWWRGTIFSLDEPILLSGTSLKILWTFRLAGDFFWRVSTTVLSRQNRMVPSCFFQLWWIWVNLSLNMWSRKMVKYTWAKSV